MRVIRYACHHLTWVVRVVFLLLLVGLPGCGGSSNDAIDNLPNTEQASNQLPVFTSSSDIEVPLNQLEVGTVTATDEDVDTLTMSISRGDDRELFELVPTTSGAADLRFREAPSNGVFDVVVLVEDGNIGVEQEISVTVGCGNPEPDSTIISDFECQQNLELVSSSGDMVLAVVENPESGGINQSVFVGKYQNPAAPDESIRIDLGSSIGSMVDLSDTGDLRVQVLAPEGTSATTLTARLQGGTGSPERTVNLTTNGQWVDYGFDFTDVDQDHTELLLFFGRGVPDATDTFFIDNLVFVQMDCPPIDLKVINDFECQQNREISDVTSVANPDQSGANISAVVGEFTDPPEAFVANVINFEDPIDLSTRTDFKIQVRSPIDSPVVAKLEAGSSPAFETAAQLVTAGSWQELTFDFSSQAAASHRRLVLFFNFSVDNAGTDVYQIDNLRFDCPAQDLSVVHDFDCQQNQTLPADVAIVANPDQSGINPSPNVGEFTDTPDAFGALVIDYGESIDLSANNFFKIQVRSPIESPVVAKLEGGSSPAFETLSQVALAGDWQELTFDFSSQAVESHRTLVLFFNFAVDNAGNDVYQIDNLRFTSSPQE